MRQSVFTSLDGAWNLGSSRFVNRRFVNGMGRVLFLLTTACLWPADEARSDDAPGSSEQVTAGRELFLREWQVDDRYWVARGLGPMYNAASCVKCHGLGGVGGAGPNDVNVDLLTVKVPRNVTAVSDGLRQRVTAFHPALASGRLSATTVLHRFSPDADYEAWRKRFLTPSEHVPLARIMAVTAAASKHPVKAANPIQRLDGMAYQHSQRNTPALFGAGMIDRLPDSTFNQMEERQAEPGGVSGRVPRTATGAVGRFGWRGQTVNLHEFVLGACAVELGLEAPGHPEPIDPLRVSFDDRGRPVLPAHKALDISDEQCKSLTQFVAHLPPPRRLMPTDYAEAETAAKGEKQFQKIGCADCHVQQVADITRIYSDLLLHDMGEGLEDPVPANGARGSGLGASYYGGTDSLLAKVPPELRREWRTPPLWGVRDSGPYLHDGRAETFTEAIAWHGGEAAKSARAFRFLVKEEQEDLLAFLDCLAAPTPESLAPENTVLAGDE